MYKRLLDFLFDGFPEPRQIIMGQIEAFRIYMHLGFPFLPSLSASVIHHGYCSRIEKELKHDAAKS
jgi:hypothetical protein